MARGKPVTGNAEPARGSAALESIVDGSVHEAGLCIGTEDSGGPNWICVDLMNTAPIGVVVVVIPKRFAEGAIRHSCTIQLATREDDLHGGEDGNGTAAEILFSSAGRNKCPRVGEKGNVFTFTFSPAVAAIEGLQEE
jgi:hypothetical protein